MATPDSPATPNFALAGDFTLPPLDAEAMRTVNEVYSLEHYTSVPLMGASDRERVFGHAHPEGPVGDFACRGFVIHTLEEAEEGIAADTIIAPPPELDELAFLELCLGLNSIFELGDFKERATPLRQVVAALGRTGVPAATGVSISVKFGQPDVAVPSLVLPRIYVSEFGSKQSVDPPNEYGANTSAALFNYLTAQQLKALEK